jgi:hypothetical protein
MRLVRAAVISVGFLVYSTSAVLAQTLAWDPNPESDIAGYRVFYGTQSGSYPNEIDVGNQTYYTPPSGFDWSRTLYFAVKAYNTSGLFSSFSAELQWVPPDSAPPTITSIDASTSYPLTAGERVTWTATASHPSPLEYRFYLYRKTVWTLAQDYSASNTFTWTPAGADVGEPYTVQAWVRRVGSTAQYEGWLSTPTFAVTAAALEIKASVDFPTPPGNEVTWTAHVPSGYNGTLEYMFLVANESDQVFTVFRDYATSNMAQWTAPAIGRYAVRVLARAVGSTAASEFAGTTPFFDVSHSALSLTALTTATSSPTTTGTAITWAARAKGGSAGPLQYQFWVYSADTGWKLGQPYGSSSTFTWTPTWADQGEHVVQVWVRNNGSTATYEAWRSSAPIWIDRAAMTLTTTTLFPAAPGSHVDWKAAVPDPSANLEYQFWVYSAASASWSLGRPYDVDPVFRWIPSATGEYTIQAWGRQVGSTAAYEVVRGTNLLSITQEPVQVASITTDVTFPAPAGSPITWTAAALGGTAGPLEYQFWRWSNGGWILAQPYSTSNSYTWTPTLADVGDHALQVWVRSAGSTAQYEAFKSTGTFQIK